MSRSLSLTRRMHTMTRGHAKGTVCRDAHLGVRLPELQLRHHELCVLVVLGLELVALCMVAAQLRMLPAATLEQRFSHRSVHATCHELTCHESSSEAFNHTLPCPGYAQTPCSCRSRHAKNPCWSQVLITVCLRQAGYAAPACYAARAPSAQKAWEWPELPPPAAASRCPACPVGPPVPDHSSHATDSKPSPFEPGFTASLAGAAEVRKSTVNSKEVSPMGLTVHCTMLLLPCQSRTSGLTVKATTAISAACS